MCAPDCIDNAGCQAQELSFEIMLRCVRDNAQEGDSEALYEFCPSCVNSPQLNNVHDVKSVISKCPGDNSGCVCIQSLG